jgi:hypothetical protein
MPPFKCNNIKDLRETWSGLGLPKPAELVNLIYRGWQYKLRLRDVNVPVFPELT